jgi:hypothetical protein
MYMTMIIQRTPLAKGLTTQITNVRTLSSLYMTMIIQDIPVGKVLTTHITSIRTSKLCI